MEGENMLRAPLQQVSRGLGGLAIALLSVSPLCSQSPDGWIQDHDWLFLGPLGNPNGCGGGGGDAMLDNWIAPLDIATITPHEGEEPEIDFAAAASAGWNGPDEEPAWTSLELLGFFDGDLVDITQVAAVQGVPAEPNVMAVAVTYVTYEGDEPIIVDVCNASDDSVQVWVNSSLVQNLSICRGTNAGCAEISPALLLPGKNTIRVLVWQGTFGWGFRLRLQQQDGTVITEEDPDFDFGFDELDALILPPASVSRSVEEAISRCATGGDATVTLQGDGSDGPAVTLVETVRGPVEVVDITGGGQLAAFAAGGGEITWDGLTREAVDAGVSYGLRGDGTAVVTGHDGANLISGVNFPTRCGGIACPSEINVSTGAGIGILDYAHGVGSPCIDGTSVYDPADESYTITGGGTDIWQEGDQFEYAYREVSGDFTMVARIAQKDWAAGSRWGRVGIMARQDCTKFSRYSAMQTHGDDPQDSDSFAGREAHGGLISYHQTPFPSENPAVAVHREWQRLDRISNTFIGYVSDDGESWQEVGRANWTANAPETVLVGLYAHAHSDSTGANFGDGCVPTTAVFDNVELSFPSFSVTRSVPDWCPPDANEATVLLLGEGDPGSPLRIVETVSGAVEVSDISHGGSFEPAPPHVIENPVGIWDGTADVGEPCVAGSTVDNPDGSYTITGGGTDIWQAGDQFHYAYRLATGDFNMTVRIPLDDRQWAAGSRWGRAGIMARQNADPRSSYVMIMTHGADLQDSDRLQGRNTHGGADNFEHPTPTGFEHEWQRMERVGDVLNSYLSVDGENWDFVASWRTQAPTVMLGLAVNAHSDSTGADFGDGCVPATIVFDEIEIGGGDGPHEPLASGGTITWDAVPRANLELGFGGTGGVTYTLARTAASGNTVFVTGTVDDVDTSGTNVVPLVDVATDDLGLFDVAHTIGDSSGTPCIIGSSTYNADEESYTITGGGNDIWTDGDQFEYAYKRHEGDFSVVAHLLRKDWAPADRWGKVGIMARQDCSDRSRYTMIQTHGEDPQDSDRVAGRVTHGGTDNFEQSPFPTADPGLAVHSEWMRLDRVGNQFIGYVSDDGSEWIQTGEHNWGHDAPDDVLLGLAVCSHSVAGCVTATIQFDSVEIRTTYPEEEDCDTEGDEDGNGLADCDDPACADLEQCRPGGFVRGDGNANGSIDLTDGVVTLNYLFIGGDAPACLDAADSDDNGGLVISDAVIIFSWLFTGGAAPVDPAPRATAYPGEDCGPDPTDDDPLDCGVLAPQCR